MILDFILFLAFSRLGPGFFWSLIFLETDPVFSKLETISFITERLGAFEFVNLDLQASKLTMNTLIR